MKVVLSELTCEARLQFGSPALFETLNHKFAVGLAFSNHRKVPHKPAPLSRALPIT